MSLVIWLHHLFNPHCQLCEEKEQDKKICLSCETLRTELAAVRFENRQLMESILKQLEPAVPHATTMEVKQPDVVQRAAGWRWKKQELESNDRKAAQIMRDKIREAAESNKSTAELEKELLGEDDAVSGSNAKV